MNFDLITQIRKFPQTIAMTIFRRMRKPHVQFAPKADLQLRGPCDHDGAIPQSPTVSSSPERQRPTKEEVRRWLQRVIESGLPPPPIADIKRDLWCPKGADDDGGRHDCP